MATPHASPAVPVPLEQYAHAFDDLFHTHLQRRRFREYLAGLLAPRDRNKTLTALVGAEPITQAQTAPVQQLQFFLTEAEWEAEAVTRRRIEVLRADPLTTPHGDGALVIDETGDRKDGTHTAHVGYQYLGSIGKLGNGIVAVTSLWADQHVYYPLHVRPYTPYTPAARLAGGKQDPAFRTKPQLGLELVQAARAAGIPFRAVVADSLYGEHPEFTRTLWQADIPLVLAVKPSEIVWTPAPASPWESPWEAAGRLRWGKRQHAQHPGVWTAVVRRFHDGHEEAWWAVDRELGGSYGPERSYRLVVATSDPRTLPKASTWYLITNLPLPGATQRAAEHPALPAAELAEVVRLYGLRQWVEPGRQGLQAGQTGVGLGRLPGARRPRHPPALGARVRCLLLLLVGRRPSGAPAAPGPGPCRRYAPTAHCGSAPSEGGSGGNIRHLRGPGRPCPPPPPHRRRPGHHPGHGRSGTSRAGLIRGARCCAAGKPGRTPHRHQHSRRCWTP